MSEGPFKAANAMLHDALEQVQRTAFEVAIKAAEGNLPRNEPGGYARGRFAAADSIRDEFKRIEAGWAKMRREDASE